MHQKRAAPLAAGQPAIMDAKELRVKATDRIAVISDEFSKCGAYIECTHDGMVIEGHQNLCPTEFDSHGDHRIAMSCAVLALMLDKESKIANSEAASVSYPDFFDDLERLR